MKRPAIPILSAMTSSTGAHIYHETGFMANYSGAVTQNNAIGKYIAQGSGPQYNAETMIFGQESPLSFLPVATDAPFNSSKNQHDPLCLPNTRVGVLQEIESWVDGQGEKCIFWLNGLVGTGKSTVARTIARRYYDKERLGASFFFSRGGGDVSHAGKFFTSIASQLAEEPNILKDHIYEAILRRPGIGSKCFRDQWTHLILQPLSRLNAESIQSPLLVIVDALDECDEDDDIQAILQCLAELNSQDSALIRIFITSRPETPIELGFDEMPGTVYQELVLHDVSRKVIDKDISVFFREKFKKMRNTFKYLPVDWPGEKIITLLVERSEGLFIFAATVCRFIQGDEEWTPQDLLQIFLPRDSSASHHESGVNISSTSPTLQLDEMYTTVLQHSFRKVKKDRDKIAELFRNVIGSIAVLWEPLSEVAISGLLGLTPQKETSGQQKFNHTLKPHKP